MKSCGRGKGGTATNKEIYESDKRQTDMSGNEHTKKKYWKKETLQLRNK
jgi:hypothetical protein